jgi:hypothetical protein
LFIVPFCRFRRIDKHRYEKRDGAGKAEREEMSVHVSRLPQAEHFSTCHLSSLIKRDAARGAKRTSPSGSRLRSAME